MRTALFFILTVVGISLFLHFETSAQNTDTLRTTKPIWYLKIAPFSAIEPMPTLLLQVERQVPGQVAYALDFGLIANLWSYNYSQHSFDAKHPSFVIRPEVRFYTPDGKRGNYFALQGVYKKINLLMDGFECTEWEKTDWGYSCVGEEIEVQYRAKRSVTALYAKYGMQYKVSKRVYIDTYFGLGMRYVKNKIIDKPFNPWGDDDMFIFNNVFEMTNYDTNQSFIHLSPSAGVRVGLRLGKI